MKSGKSKRWLCFSSSLMKRILNYVRIFLFGLLGGCLYLKDSLLLWGGSLASKGQALAQRVKFSATIAQRVKPLFKGSTSRRPSLKGSSPCSKGQVLSDHRSKGQALVQRVKFSATIAQRVKPLLKFSATITQRVKPLLKRSSSRRPSLKGLTLRARARPVSSLGFAMMHLEI